MLSHVIFGILTLVLFLTCFYPETENIKSAMAYQGSMDFRGVNNTGLIFLQSYIEFIPYLPILIFPPLILIETVFAKKMKALLFLISACMVAAVSVLMQNRFSSPYHYLSFQPVILLFFLGFDRKELYENRSIVKKDFF